VPGSSASVWPGDVRAWCVCVCVKARQDEGPYSRPARCVQPGSSTATIYLYCIVASQRSACPRRGPGGRGPSSPAAQQPSSPAAQQRHPTPAVAAQGGIRFGEASRDAGLSRRPKACARLRRGCCSAHSLRSQPASGRDTVPAPPARPTPKPRVWHLASGVWSGTAEKERRDRNEGGRAGWLHRNRRRPCAQELAPR